MANASVATIFLALSALSFGRAEDGDARKPHIVHVIKTMKPSHFTSHKHWYASLLHQVSHLDPIPSDLLYTYDIVSDGFAAMLSRREAERMERMDGCLAVIPSSLSAIDTTRSPEFLGLASSSEYSKYGEDIIIGVIDTGIWPESKSFNDEGLGPVSSRWKGKCEDGWMFNSSNCNRKIIGALYFSKGYEKHNDIILEQKSPRDIDGHGTHVASIAAGAEVRHSKSSGFANGTARGMAPKARLAIYKTCWNDSCDDCDILAAMERAIADGVDIISISISSPDVPFYISSRAIASFKAIRMAVLVSAAAGNDGPFLATLRNTAPWITTVGASSIDRDFPASVMLGNGEIYRGTSTYKGASNELLAGPLMYVSPNTNPHGLDYKIVLCYGGSPTAEAVAHAEAAGIIVGNKPLLGAEQQVTDPNILPAISVSFMAGQKIKSYICSNVSNATMVMNITGSTVVGNEITAPIVAAFSSRGPSVGHPYVLISKNATGL